ncbi:MAG: menaquinone biosynthesis decarboxylase [Candidatus Methylomirabilota bacterium]|nr:menaquinone biosynthesis decarboxylase [Candidatus Methylomirabilis sp.]NJD67437.1 menaquinone biosynthesis decarboxylase [candidate division NC10 bacterium]PWB48584.1 MAG: menaquinone biosynthesis decarboxylase [candidate division NC10 bacterium]
MAYDDLRAYIAALEQRGLLKRIKTEVDPILEVTEITDRVSKRLGPALLFERVKGSSMPLLINAFGSEAHLCLALQRGSLDELAEELGGIFEIKSPEGWLEKLKMLPKLTEMASYLPKRVKDGPCKEVRITKEPSFDLLPVIKCWPLDGGRFITFPLVFTKDPETGTRNCGMYRMQIYDERTAGMHWHIHHGGARHYEKNRRSGRRTEVAVAIGPDPATTLSAVIPAPDGVDEMLIAGFLRKRAVEMTPCESVDLEVPANAEIVLEGYVEPDELRLEGPFGDHTGFYSLPDYYPVFHLTAVTHRRNPIYQTTIVGRPPMEDCHMGTAVERMSLPLLRKQLPEIVDFHMPFAGVFHNLVIVSIDKTYPGHARKIMHAIWGMGQAMFSKVIVVVDKEVNVRDPAEVVWKVLNHIDPERDIEFVMGPVETLDHASRLPKYGSKMGIDGTRKWKGEGFARDWPEEQVMDRETKTLVDRRWQEYGLD